MHMLQWSLCKAAPLNYSHLVQAPSGKLLYSIVYVGVPLQNGHLPIALAQGLITITDRNDIEVAAFLFIIELMLLNLLHYYSILQCSRV